MRVRALLLVVLLAAGCEPSQSDWRTEEFTNANSNGVSTSKMKVRLKTQAWERLAQGTKVELPNGTMSTLNAEQQFLTAEFEAVSEGGPSFLSLDFYLDADGRRVTGLIPDVQNVVEGLVLIKADAPMTITFQSPGLNPDVATRNLAIKHGDYKKWAWTVPPPPSSAAPQ